MSDATPCSHCKHKASVLPVDDPKHSRTIYICLNCNWWGTEADKIANPMPEKASVKIVWPDRS